MAEHGGQRDPAPIPVDVDAELPGTSLTRCNRERWEDDPSLPPEFGLLVCLEERGTAHEHVYVEPDQELA
jgi:hypothetical protein